MSLTAKCPASPAPEGEKGEWYLIQTRPRQEARAHEHLANQGFEVFYPRLTVARLNKGQESQRQEPLFPNYLFVRLRAGTDNWSPIRSTRGVLRMVTRSEEHTSELQSRFDIVCRLLLEKKKEQQNPTRTREKLTRRTGHNTQEDE